MSGDPTRDCWAGRWAFFDQSPDWMRPCPDAMLVQHLVTDPDTPRAARILLCTKHYNDVERGGLVAEPTPTPERLAKFQLQERRKGRHGRRA